MRIPERLMELAAACRGSLFHKERPVDANHLNSAIEVQIRQTKRFSRSEDRRGRREDTSVLDYMYVKL